MSDLRSGSPHRISCPAAGVVLLVLAAAWGRPELAVLALWLFVVSVWSSRRSKRLVSGLSATRLVAPAAFEDDLLPVHLALENRSRRKLRFVELIDRFGAAIAERQHSLDVGPLPAGSVRVLRYEGACSRLWGSYLVGPVSLVASDALGLVKAVKTLPLMAQLSLFPRVHEVGGLVPSGGRLTWSAEDETLARAGQSPLYLGVREYVPGDDPRRIHWRASARTGSLMMKEQEVDLVPYLSLFLDLDRRHRAGLGRKSTREYVVRTGASLLAAALRRGQVVQLFADAAEPVFVPPGRGEGHLLHALERLIHVKQDGERSVFDTAADRLPSLPTGSTLCLLLSTASPEPAELALFLERLERRGLRAVVVLVDGTSFQQLEGGGRPAPAQRVARARALDLLAGCPHALLDAGDELEDRLRRGLFSP